MITSSVHTNNGGCMLELKTIECSKKTVDQLHRVGSLDIEDYSLDPNSNYFLFKGEDGSSGIACANGDYLKRVNMKGVSFSGMKPKDITQSCFFHALKNYDLVVGLGAAGTGKTSLSLAYALHQLFRKDMNIVLCKPTIFVGQKSNAIGAIPGDHREKLAGYIDSYLVSMRKILGDSAEHHLYQMEEEGKLQFQPLELIRGMHFEDTVLIIDEAQNCSPHELMSIISRVGENSTCIVLGDPSQIDSGSRWKETGLFVLTCSDAFFDSEFSIGIKLTGQYRGPMATLASNVLKELQEVEDRFIDSDTLNYE